MTRQTFPTNPNYERSVQGLHRLHSLAVAGRNETPEADEVRASLERNYVAWSEEVAAKADFIHLNQLALTRYADLSPADIKTKYFTAADNTHTSPAGAELNAACVVEGVRGLKGCKLKDVLLPEKK